MADLAAASSPSARPHESRRGAAGKGNQRPARHYRAVWLSDVHLGTRACRVEPFLEFLSGVTCDSLYLVGDILDLPNLRRRSYWPRAHREAFARLLRRASDSCAVTYIPGNHDAVLRRHAEGTLGGMRLRREGWHVTADGRGVLILHGDEFDWTATDARRIVAFGDWIYDILLFLGRGYHVLRKLFRWPYWSLAAYVKRNVGYIDAFVEGYRKALAAYARRRNAQVVVTGHVHRPEIRALGDVVYVNCGDWLENCTALVEHGDGRLEILFIERDGVPVPAANG